MGKLLKQSTINSVLYYLGIIISSINVFWLFPFVLTTEQIGLYKLILSTSVLLVSFAQFGLGQSIVKYYPSIEKKESFFGFIIVFVSICYFIFLISLFLFKDFFAGLFYYKSMIVIKYFPLIISTSSILLFTIVLKAWYRSLLNTMFPTMIQNVFIFFCMGITGIMYYKGLMNFQFLLFSIFLIYLAGLAILTLNLYLRNELKVSFNFASFDKGFYKNFIVYNIYTLAGNSAFQLVTKLDTIMISSFIGLGSNGIYATVILLAKLIEIPRRAVKQISVPILSQLIKEKDYDSIESLYKRASLNQFIVGFIIFILIYVNIDDFFRVIPNGINFTAGKMAVLFLSITKLIDSLFSIGGDIVIMSKYFRFNIIALGLLATFSILSNYLMIPIFNITGAAAATMISCLVYNLIICIYIYIKFKIHPLSTKFIHVLTIGLIAYVSLLIVPVLERPILNIFFKSGVSLCVYFMLIYYFKISSEFNNFIKQMTKKFKIKIQ